MEQRKQDLRVKEYIEINKSLWNSRTDVHVNSKFYDLPGFMAGKQSLKKIELGILKDISNKTLLHLQCHFGQDTISLARMGGVVTGLDFSDKAIRKARELAGQLEIPANFVCCNVLEADQFITEQFDVVFTSYGVVGWLADLGQWASVINKLLKPGGRFILVEFHPMVWMFNDEFTHVQHSYFNRGGVVEEEAGSYADKSASINQASVVWNHGIGEVLQPLLDNGLELSLFCEYDYSPYNCFLNTVPVADGYQIKGYEGKLPMVYAVEMVKRAP